MIDVRDINDTTGYGFRIIGPTPVGTADSKFGVVEFGDFNGDRIHDLAIGSHFLGTVYILFGKHSTRLDIDLQDPIPQDVGYKITGTSALEFGAELHAGDVNGTYITLVIMSR